jgi:hypothetical protein
MVRKKICKTIHLAPWGTAAGTYWKVRGTVAPPTVVGHGGMGPVSFQKFVIFLFELGWR